MSMRFTALLALLLTLAPLTRAEVPIIKPDSDLDGVLDALDAPAPGAEGPTNKPHPRLDGVPGPPGARGRDLKDFTADVAIHSTDARTGEDSAQLGKVTFQDRGNGDSRIRVSFDTKQTEAAD